MKNGAGIFSYFFKKRASLEDPNTPLTLDAVFSKKLGSPDSVSTTSAQSLTAVSAAIRLLSETMAQLPLNLYERTAAGRAVATDHPLNRLVSEEPNSDCTSFVFKQALQHAILVHGNGYAHIVKGKRSGDALSIDLLDSSSTKAVRGLDGVLSYHTKVNGRDYVIPTDSMIHIPAMTSDGINGISPIKAHAVTLGLSLAVDTFGSQFFSNGTNVGMVLEQPVGSPPMSKDARLRLKSSWDALRGSGYEGMALLEEGLTCKRIGIPPEDAQFLETRKFQVVEVARIYNIPPHMLRDLEKSSFSNITEQSIEFLRYTMMPWIIKWEQELNKKLIRREDRAKYYFKFNVNALLRGTQEQRYSAYQVGVSTGFMSNAQVRELEDMDYVAGLDSFLLPLNMGVVGAEKSDNVDAGKKRYSLDAVITRASENFANWQNKLTDANSKDQALFVQKYSDGVDSAIERHFSAVLDTVCDNKQQKTALVNELKRAAASVKLNEHINPNILTKVFNDEH